METEDENKNKFCCDLKIHSIRHKINVEYYESLFSDEVNDKIFRRLEKTVKWTTKPSNGRRCSQTYGDDGLSYEVMYRDKIIERVAQSWNDVKCLIILKELAEEITGERFNFCVVQRYSNGNVGINPHKDREIKEGNSICGFSFGATRTLRLGAPKFLSVEDMTLSLKPGSLYIMKGSTNKYWTHEIVKDPSIKTPRISLTFRRF